MANKNKDFTPLIKDLIEAQHKLLQQQRPTSPSHRTTKMNWLLLVTNAYGPEHTAQFFETEKAAVNYARINFNIDATEHLICNVTKKIELQVVERSTS